MHRWKCKNCDTIFVKRHPSYPHGHVCKKCNEITKYENLGPEIPYKYRDDPEALEKGLPYVKEHEEELYKQHLAAIKTEDLDKGKKKKKGDSKKKSKKKVDKKAKKEKKADRDSKPEDKPPPEPPKLPDFSQYGPKTWLKKMRELSEKENAELHEL